MEQLTSPVEKKVKNFLTCTSPKQSRKALMNVFFNCDQKQISNEDKEEIHMLYILLENLSGN
jgi:hypothetical protein